MTDKEILQKTIEIAMENGMNPKTVDKGTFFQIYWLNKGRAGSKLDTVGYSVEDCYGVIFSHDFAKAFWGKEMVGTTGKKISEVKPRIIGGVDANTYKITGAKPEWKYHLQQMILEENPIQYLKKNLYNYEKTM